ncbi:Transmembrane and ubiquitin-like domain-containing protein 2 [Echinococcus granulosus]|uniref:Transmembrane and ubiquitin n=1 Tax=Echinococcus granulosus TaxID=6210 RepID=A0A068X0F2_ECHGR|nr:Transmembrane and ubiquitin-like domain-containing protein 2 [Echinococcus granulosus]CDS24263.1 Transmembrane and ubiquitin [Echinococcus granulosus]
MILPEFIEGIGNEVLICALSLGGILLCVGFRLYSHGFRILSPTSNTHNQSMNSNSDVVESTENADSDEGAVAYHTGVLDTDYMESLRDINHHLDTDVSEAEASSMGKTREDNERELRAARAQGNIVLRLQYLNDRVRYVHAPPEMPVLLFKRKFFADELERQHKSVRLIFQGRELKPPAVASRDSPSRRRLCDYGVSDNATIHCLISDAPPHPTPSSSSTPADRIASATGSVLRPNFSAPEDLDFGSHAMMPLFAFLLTSVWIFRFAHAEYFSLVSTVALVCLSALFAGAVFSSATVNRRRTAERSSVAAGDAIQTS